VIEAGSGLGPSRLATSGIKWFPGSSITRPAAAVPEPGPLMLFGIGLRPRFLFDEIANLAARNGTPALNAGLSGVTHG